MAQPMPSFADALTPEQRWAITDFIVSLSGTDTPAYTNLVVAKYAPDPIDLKNGTKSFESAPVARFPIIGQITEPGREFHPPATAVTVQAMYDSESIAFLVRWHDRSAEKTGKNDPSLPVPIEEEEARLTAGAAVRASAARRRRTPLATRKSRQPPRAGAPAGAPQDPFAEAQPAAARHPSSPTQFRSRFLRRCRRAPASPTSSSATPELGGSLVLRSGAPDPLQFTGKGSAISRPTTRGCHRCRELRPG
jgi:hypothetical protein